MLRNAGWASSNVRTSSAPSDMATHLLCFRETNSFEKGPFIFKSRNIVKKKKTTSYAKGLKDCLWPEWA